jgi:hypothetical protein
VGFISAHDAPALDAALRSLDLAGMTLRGAAPLWLGARQRPRMARGVKEAGARLLRGASLDD